MNTSALRIAVVFPELLGTYGDGGNVLVLQRRLAWRGLACETVPVALDSPVPADCDLYVLGGGEDSAQTAALAALRRSPGLHQALGRGAPVFAVCAGLQLLGVSVMDRDGVVTAGLGLLDAETRLGPTRLVGPVTGRPDPALGLPLMSGFANHAGRTRLGPQARPLATLTSGPGNDDADGADASREGALQGGIVASYLHGPVLARNPGLADLLLARGLGEPVEPLPQTPGPSAGPERSSRRWGRRASGILRLLGRIVSRVWRVRRGETAVFR